MIQHVVERALTASILSKVYVATDDTRIAEAVIDFGGDVVMTRENHVSGSDRLAEAAEKIDLPKVISSLISRGTSPFSLVRSLHRSRLHCLDDPSLDMSTLIYKIIRKEEINDPNHVKTVFDRNHYALYFSRSAIHFREIPEEAGAPTYYKHLGFYAYRKRFLLEFVALPEGEWERFEKLEQLRALENGYKIKVVLTEHDSVEVDTEEELQRVGALMRQAE